MNKTDAIERLARGKELARWIVLNKFPREVGEEEGDILIGFLEVFGD